VEVDARYFRPAEVDLLVGDYSKAKEKLGWEPKIQVEQLVKEMMASDLELFRRDKFLLEGGHKVLNFHE
jgi:GDPmannose 4,6-dehydratase